MNPPKKTTCPARAVCAFRIGMFLLMCAMGSPSIFAGTKCWTPCSGNVCCAGNWCGGFPNGCHNAQFGTCPTSNCITVNLGCGTTSVGQIRVNHNTSNGTVGTYNFTGTGTLRTNNGKAVQLRSGTTNISGGGTFVTRGNGNVSLGNTSTCQTVNLNLTNASTVEANWNCSNAQITFGATSGTQATATAVGGSRFRAGGDIIIASVACATVNVSLSGSTMETNGGDIKVGQNGHGTLTLTCASTISANKLNVSGSCGSVGRLISTGTTINLCNDFDIGECQGAAGYATITGGTVCVGADFIVGQQCGGDGTAYISGGTWCVGGGFTLADHSGGGCVGSAHVTITGGANITQTDSYSGCGHKTSRFGTPGKNHAVTLNVQGGSTLTINDASHIEFGCETIVDLCNGTIKGTADMKFGGCGTIIRGNGTIENNIRLFRDCGVFQADAGETLTLSGSITQDDANNDLVFNGSGKLSLGASDIIDNSNTDLDIDINGGTLDMNGTSQGADNAVIGTLTLTASSTIEFTSGDASQDLFVKDLSWAGTLNITDWDGSAGANGTGGRILVEAATSSFTVGDNGGSGYSGINWNSGAFTSYEVLSVTINGTLFHEIVPHGVAVPEASTWIGSLGILFYTCIHRRLRKLKNG